MPHMHVRPETRSARRTCMCSEPSTARIHVQVRNIVDNADGQLCDPSGYPLPAFIVMERGESLDKWSVRAKPDRWQAIAVCCMKPMHDFQHPNLQSSHACAAGAPCMAARPPMHGPMPPQPLPQCAQATAQGSSLTALPSPSPVAIHPPCSAGHLAAVNGSTAVICQARTVRGAVHAVRARGTGLRSQGLSSQV
jgi:hypothetical protein